MIVAWFWSDTRLGEILKISGEALNVESSCVIWQPRWTKLMGNFEEKTIDFKAELLNISSNFA
jgi:hypothetical protein